MKRLHFLLTATLLLLLCSCGGPEKSQLAMDKGISLMYDKSRFAEAVEQFDQAIKYNKDNFEAYYYRGCAKFNMNKLNDAIVDLEKALEIKPGYADAEFTLGRIYFILDDHDMSCYYYKASMQHGRANVEDDVKGCP